MIYIQRAILHILDCNSALRVLSDQELTVEGGVETFLLKHIEKADQDQNSKPGAFYEDSAFRRNFAAYIREETLDFVEFSRVIAETFYGALQKSEQLESADLLVLDLVIDGRRKLAIFKCVNKIGYIHQVLQTEVGIKNEIANHYAILPGLTQKMDEYAFIDAETEELRIFERTYVLGGEKVCIFSECVLECASAASPKETMDIVGKITKKVAENHGYSSVEAVTAAKNLIAENVLSDQSLQPAAMGEKIFRSSPAMQAEYMQEIQQAGVADSVRVESEFALKKIKNHKIKTDTGIEISIPLDYFKNTEYIEFINHPDGTISINIKNVMKLINK